MTSFTGFLYGRGSFLSGIGRILDAGGTFDSYNASPTPELADAVALYADWKTIGNDMRTGLGKAAEWEEEVQPWLIEPSEVRSQR